MEASPPLQLTFTMVRLLHLFRVCVPEVTVGLRGGVASTQNGPKCAPSAARLPATSMARMWK